METVTNQTVVIDNGSGVIKAGFAGSQKPSVLLPTYVGRPRNQRCMAGAPEGETFIGQKASDLRGLLRLQWPVDHGIVQDWGDMELLWNAVYQQLKTTPEYHPILLTEPPNNPREVRERSVELFFETFNSPALFLATQAVLALYTSGRITGLVVDVGDGVTHVVPVYNGFALQHSIKRSDVAGRDVTERLVHLLRRAGRVFHTSAEMEIVRQIKEAACYVTLAPSRDDFPEFGYTGHAAIDRSNTRGVVEQKQSVSDFAYKLPDGTQVVLRKERFRAPEVLFTPALLGVEYPGVHHLVSHAVIRAEIDLRRELLSQIVLSGGSTMVQGFVDRLLTEVRKTQAKDCLIRVYAPPERQFTTFVGGSILGSLATFKNMWITKTAYQEEGPSLLERRYI